MSTAPPGFDAPEFVLLGFRVLGFLGSGFLKRLPQGFLLRDIYVT